jgi:hypothetical protein
MKTVLVAPYVRVVGAANFLWALLPIA